MNQGREEEALGLLQRSMDLIERFHSEEPCPRTNDLLAEITLALGDLHNRQGEGEQAEKRWREAIRLLELNVGKDRSAANRLMSAGIWRRLGVEERARPHAELLFAKGWRWQPAISTTR